jgi:hypothetical protein
MYSSRIGPVWKVYLWVRSYKPEKMLARLAAQMGVLENAFLK